MTASLPLTPRKIATLVPLSKTLTNVDRQISRVTLSILIAVTLRTYSLCRPKVHLPYPAFPVSDRSRLCMEHTMIATPVQPHINFRLAQLRNVVLDLTQELDLVDSRFRTSYKTPILNCVNHGSKTFSVAAVYHSGSNVVFRDRVKTVYFSYTAKCGSFRKPKLYCFTHPSEDTQS